MDGGVPRASASAALVRSRTGVNNLVDSAASLFDLVIYLRGQAAPLNIDQLRSKTLALLDEFKAKAAAARNEQAVIDAEAWAESGSVKASFNAALTAGDFKSTATADQKRLILIWALWSIVKG